MTDLRSDDLTLEGDARTGAASCGTNHHCQSNETTNSNHEPMVNWGSLEDPLGATETR